MIRQGIACIALTIAFADACVDTTPIVVEALGTDASVIGRSADSSAGSACRECIVAEGAPCHAEYAKCLTMELCPEVMACAFRNGCVTFPLIEDRIQCAQPCLDAVQFSSTNPALPTILAINDCSQNACRRACIIE